MPKDTDTELKRLIASVALNETEKPALLTFLQQYHPQTKLLYRYRSLMKFAREKEALENNKIWLSYFEDLNDPFETSMGVDSANHIPAEPVDSAFLINETGFSFNSAGLAQMFLSNEDDKLMQDTVMGHLANAQHNYGRYAHLASFCETSNNLLLWAHYASDHKGICVGYSREALFEYFGAQLLPVIYDEHRCQFGGEQQRAIEDAFGRFVVKSPEWEYEQEWRIIKHHPEPNTGGAVDVPMPCEIYLGCRIDPEHENNLRALCESKGIAVYKMSLHPAEFKLNDNKNAEE